MKITLQNANEPFRGSIIEICNLVAGAERFRIQSVPLLGSILWDGNKQLEIEKPFDGEKLLKETGVEIQLHWFESCDQTKDQYPKRLGKIYIGTKWTGPLLWIDVQNGSSRFGGKSGDTRTFAIFSKGNFGGNFASGGNWTHAGNIITEGWRDSTPEERAQGRGQQTQADTPCDGFASIREAFDYRFSRETLKRNGQARLFTESVELRDHVETVLKSIGLL